MTVKAELNWWDAFIDWTPPVDDDVVVRDPEIIEGLDLVTPFWFYGKGRFGECSDRCEHIGAEHWATAMDQCYDAWDKAVSP